ncbi:hypothetical protein BD779DRAFT_1493546 [Infundibulicybe gibba]|nr:hypothetical protein BD779DRAFT_1493546 [Infundibulicybe gibba]
MLCRERRSWTAKEDQLLRDAVDREDPANPNPSKWHAIAKHVPNRTNKDCRKRWFAKMASDVVKGGWAPDEDEKLVKGIERYGTRWSLVASIVQTRNSDQCAKRWTDTLNPAIDRTTWSPEADELLLRAVNDHGKVWTKIVKTYFPGRTGLSAKNRYNSITRFNTDQSRSARPRKTSESPSYLSHRKSESVSSSSSSSVSPITPSISIPDIHHPLFFTSKGSHSSSSIFDGLSGWSPSPSEFGDDHGSINLLNSRIDGQQLLSFPTPSDTPQGPFEISMNHALSSFTEEAPHTTYPTSANSCEPFFSNHYIDEPHQTQPSSVYNNFPSHELYAFHSQPSDTFQAAPFMYNHAPTHVDQHSGTGWGERSSAVPDTIRYGRPKTTYLF